MFYLNFFFHGLATPIALLTTRAVAWAIAVQWMHGILFFWRWTTGSTYEYRGVENIPDGGFIIGSKHQSTWETIGLAPLMYEIVFILKKELMYIPIFGWFCAKAKMIPINRGKGSKVIGPMTEKAREAIEAGRRIVIFMEGTRVQPGSMLPYKVGVVRLYQDLNCPIVPIAVNTGLFWPKNGFWRYKGHVVIEVLPPIMPGLGVQEALQELERRVETATNNLILETAMGDNPPPTIHAAIANLKERGVDVSAAEAALELKM